MECESQEVDFFKYVCSISEDVRNVLPLKKASKLEECIEYIKERIIITAKIHTNSRYRTCMIHYDDHYKSSINPSNSIGKNDIVTYFSKLGFVATEDHRGITITW